VRDQDRAANVANEISCRVVKAAQPAGRQPRVEFLRDVRNRREGGLDDER
jgi:hypothetical protein